MSHAYKKSGDIIRFKIERYGIEKDLQGVANADTLEESFREAKFSLQSGQSSYVVITNRHTGIRRLVTQKGKTIKSETVRSVRPVKR